jgi:hypothetical protein
VFGFAIKTVAVAVVAVAFRDISPHGRVISRRRRFLLEVCAEFADQTGWRAEDDSADQC